jgi:DNA-directed RNA polymerase subunit RPC12/RpoP
MKTRNFTKNDEGFICENCGKKVERLGYSSRNHCPYCLHSLHVDVLPGDRENECKGIMEPVNVQVKGQKGYVIVFRCKKCKATKNNVAAKDDSQKIILKVMSNPKA